MMTAKRLEFPEVKGVNTISRKLNMAGAYFEQNLNRIIGYQAARVPIALCAFAGVGLLGGMFGLGAG